MTAYSSLLPVNSTVLERELEQSLHLVDTVDVDALRRMRDPLACSSEHLPFLAWGKGVDLWYDDWPEHRKRRITAEIYRLKGAKGTLPGMAGYLGFVDASIAEAVLPPSKVIARRQDAERQKRFRDRFAEIRVYPYAIRGARAGTVAATGGHPLAIAGRAVAHGRDPLLTYGRRAVLRDRGVETPIRSTDALVTAGGVAVPVTSFAIDAIGRASDALVGRAVVGRMVAGRPRGRLIVIGAGERAAAIPAGFEGLRTLAASPERVYERHGALARQPVASSQPKAVAGTMIARAATAELHVFDRWHLFDSERAGADAYSVLGPVVGRMIPALTPFTALLRIDARFARPGRPAIVGRVRAGRMVAHEPNDRLLRIGAAIQRAKALRDTIRFTTRMHRPATPADLTFDRPVSFRPAMVPLNRRAS